MINFVKKFYTREIAIKKIVGSLLGLSIGFVMALLTLISNGGNLTLLTALPLFGLPTVALALVILWFFPEIKHWFVVIRRHATNLLSKIRRLFKK